MVIVEADVVLDTESASCDVADEPVSVPPVLVAVDGDWIVVAVAIVCEPSVAVVSGSTMRGDPVDCSTATTAVLVAVFVVSSGVVDDEVSCPPDDVVVSVDDCVVVVEAVSVPPDDDAVATDVCGVVFVDVIDACATPRFNPFIGVTVEPVTEPAIPVDMDGACCVVTVAVVTLTVVVDDVLAVETVAVPVDPVTVVAGVVVAVPVDATGVVVADVTAPCAVSRTSPPTDSHEVCPFVLS